MAAEPHYEIKDELDAFLIHRNVGTEREGQGPLSSDASFVLVEALKQLLNEREPDAYMLFEHGDLVWTLVVIGDAAHVVQLDGRVVHVRFLGPLAGGTYSERFDLAEQGLLAEGRFEHPDLPGPLELLFEKPVPQSAFSDRRENTRRELAQRLRPTLRAWAELPATP